MNTLEVLTNARALIADPEHWCQEHLAIADAGYGVPPTHGDAYAFCALGAILHVCNVDDLWGNTREDEPNVAVQANSALEVCAVRLYGTGDVATVNDAEIATLWDAPDPYAAAHAAVLALYDCAIAGLRDHPWYTP